MKVRHEDAVYVHPRIMLTGGAVEGRMIVSILSPGGQNEAMGVSGEQFLAPMTLTRLPHLEGNIPADTLHSLVALQNPLPARARLPIPPLSSSPSVDPHHFHSSVRRPLSHLTIKFSC